MSENSEVSVEIASVKISSDTKKEIVNNLLKAEVFLNFFEEREQFIDFLSELWNLNNLPSEDPRHDTASQDFGRHLILNDDWTAEYVLVTRLKLNEEDDLTFIKFIELLISPKYQRDIDSINSLVTFFTTYLKKEAVKFVLTGYENKLPVYQLGENSGSLKNIPKNIKKNTVPFFYLGFKSYPHKIERHPKPTETPSFQLVKDNWNDFNCKTLYYLHYYPNSEEGHCIGAVKIMKREVKDTPLPDKFFLLDETYCSLGMSEEFYKNLSEKVGKDFISVLFALRDTAFFPLICEEFEDDDIFKTSLLRENDAERTLRTASYAFSGGDLAKRYNFKYTFKPLFSDSETEIHFPFSSEGELPRRIFALIGKNGTGKTQLLTSLAKNLSDRESPLFLPQTPIFGKVLAVSYSVFDTFEIPTSDNSFNYKYCGLKDPDGNLLRGEELDTRFFASLKKISERKRITKFESVLKNFIDKDIIELLITDSSANRVEWKKIELKNYPEIKKKLSSGQSLLLYVVVEILAELRFDSLILFDEPETHLHPNAITQLISTIHELVDYFDSYCLIATHSPIIVQSLTSDAVYVTEREENVFSLRKISTESFGENLTNITDEIFGNRDVGQEYKRIINEMIENGKNYSEIVDILESDGVPLNLNAKIYIRSVIKK